MTWFWRRCKALDFRIDFGDLLSGLNTFETRAEASMSMYVDTAALTLQSYMRENAPWMDRTGHARQRLTATASRVAKGYKITLAQGVDYGIFLELAHEKRFAIIQPTITAKGPEVMAGFTNLLGRLSR